MFTLLDTFLGGFFLKPKSHGFKVKCEKPSFEKSLKNLKCKFKYCNVNIFELINFCNCRIPNQQLYLCNMLSMQKSLSHMSLFFKFSSLLARLSNCMQKFQQKKQTFTGHQNLLNKKKQSLKKVFCKKRYSSKQLFCRTSS